MSSRGGGSRTNNEQPVTRFASRKHHLRIVKDELGSGEEPFVGGAMSLATDECADDRPSSPEGPGAWLRRNRENHGLTLDDLARTTKISKSILTAIETSDVLRLPAAIYTRGFVKSYAREVGLDPDRTVDDYLAEIEPLAAEHLPVYDGHVPPAARPHASLDINDDARQVVATNRMQRFGWLASAVALVGLLIYLASFATRDAAAPAAGVTVADTAGADAVPAGQDAAAGAGLPADAARAGGGPVLMELRTQGLCWVVLSVDAEPVLARLLQPGERHTFDVNQEALLRVGDPGALTLSLNGRAAGPLGTPREPVDLRITPDNVHQYLSGR